MNDMARLAVNSNVNYVTMDFLRVEGAGLVLIIKPNEALFI
jgi:hypothetical protein